MPVFQNVHSLSAGVHAVLVLADYHPLESRKHPLCAQLVAFSPAGMDTLHWSVSPSVECNGVGDYANPMAFRKGQRLTEPVHRATLTDLARHFRSRTRQQHRAASERADGLRTRGQIDQRAVDEVPAARLIDAA